MIITNICCFYPQRGVGSISTKAMSNDSRIASHLRFAYTSWLPVAFKPCRSAISVCLRWTVCQRGWHFLNFPWFAPGLQWPESSLSWVCGVPRGDGTGWKVEKREVRGL